MKSKITSFNERVFSAREISGIGIIRTKSLLQGKAAKFLNFIGRSLSYSSTRSYGSFLLSFGILSLLLNLGDYYFRVDGQVSLSVLIICATLAIASIPLLLLDKPICIALQDFRLTDHLFFEFFSIKRMHRVDHISIPPILALFIGCIPATVAFFTSIELVITVIFVTLIVAISFTSPEFPMMLTIVALPYIPLIPYGTAVLSALSLLTFLSYFMKVILGKRVFNFGIYDVIILLIGILVFVSGIFGSYDISLESTGVFIALMLSYFPASNIIVNRRLADSAINALIVSAIPIVVVSIIEFIVELPSTTFIVPEHSTPGISAFFSTPEALATFMLISAILTLVFATEKKGRLNKFFYSLIFVLELVILVLVMQPGAWVSAAVAILSYPIIKSKRTPIDTLGTVLVLPYIFYLLPADFLDNVLPGKEFSFSENLSLLKENLRLFFDNLFIGNGRGIGDAANTVVGIGAEFGVIVLALFTVLVIVRFRHLSYYRLYIRSSSVIVTAEMTALALVALFAYSSFEYIFHDSSVVYLFWFVFAVSTASLKTARREHNERLGYYGDSRSSESSALDIGINKLN